MLYSFLFTTVAGFLTMVFHDNKIYAEVIGIFAAVVEASLGVPQLYKNLVNKHTEGLSAVFILIWIIGDSFKAIYSYMIGTPIQLVLSAAFQLLVDLVIMIQIAAYGSGVSKGTTKDVREKNI